MSDPPPAPARLSSDTAAVLVLMFGAAMIGFAAPLVRLSETGPMAAAFWRLLLAAPILGVIALRVQPRLPAGRDLSLCLLAGVLFAGDLAVWHIGISLTSVANATVLSNLSPIVVALLAWIVFGDRPRPLFALGLFIGIGGAAGMAFFADHASRPSSLTGDAFSAATALWYGLYLLAVTAARRGQSAATIMFVSSLTGAPILLALAVALGEPILPADPGGWLACCGLALVHVLGQGAIAWGLGRLATPLASVILLVQPVVAAIVGVLVFNETPTFLQALAGLIALAGIWLARIAMRRRASEPAA